MTAEVQPPVGAASRSRAGIALEQAANLASHGMSPTASAATNTAAIISVARAYGFVYLPPGTFDLSSFTLNDANTKNRGLKLFGALASLYGTDSRTVLRATAAGPLIQVGDDDLLAGSSSPMNVLAEDIVLDGNAGLGETALRVTRGVNLTFRRLVAQNFSKRGFFLDGTLACNPNPLAAADLNTIEFDSCTTKGCGTAAGDGGLVVYAPGVVTGSFDNIVVRRQQSMVGDKAGVRIQGVPGVQLDTCVIQPTGNGIEVVDATAVIDTTYVEAGGTSLVATASTFGGTVVTVRGASVITNPSVDANSSLIYEASQSNSLGAGVERYAIGRSCDDALWGPPNLAGKTGALWYKGQLWRDAYGVTWVCVVPGATNVSRWVPRDGKIIRPLSATELNLGNGYILWWAQDDMIIRDVTVIAGGSRAYTSTDSPAAQYLTLTTFAGANSMNLIGQSVAGVSAQLPLSAMTDAVNSTVASAAKNAAAGAAMANKEELFFAGSAPNVAPAAGNYIKQFMGVSPAHYTEGAGGPALLLINVYPLRKA